MSKVTKEMINAAHDVTMQSGMMLGHELLTKIYLAMDAQRQWVGLTDEELFECEQLAHIRHKRHMSSVRGQQISPADDFLWHYARAIEAKLKEKNK